MKRTILYPLLTLYLLIFSNGQAIASGNDSIRLSLLTCAPGEEIYSLFGHTAIRYEDPANGIDAVFNYGLFILLFHLPTAVRILAHSLFQDCRFKGFRCASHPFAHL